MQFGLLYEMQRPFEGTSVDWNSLYKETIEQCALAGVFEAERALVVEEWNRTEAPYPAESCIHERFEAQAARMVLFMALCRKVQL